MAEFFEIAAKMHPRRNARRGTIDKKLLTAGDIKAGDAFIALPDGSYRKAEAHELPPDIRAAAEAARSNNG